MQEQKDFFSKNHSRLLGFARWSKNVAWAVLVVYILNAAGAYYQEQYNHMLTGAIPSRYANFVEMLARNPVYTFSLFVEIASVFLKGVVYFLVLKGISLGLNMIVETELNYMNYEKRK